LFTYGGSDGNAYDLADAEAMNMQEASVRGYSYVLRSQISYDAAARAADSKAAFENSTKLLVATMLRSFAKRLEISAFYGQKPLAILAAGTTTTSLVLPVADWAAGIWVGAENAHVSVFNGTSNTLRGSAKVTNINLSTRTLTLDAAITGATSGDALYFQGQKKSGSAGHNDMKGLQSIIEESSSLFGIDPSSYNLWKGNEYSAGNADLSFEKIQEAIALAVEKGLDEDVVCMVNHKTWAKLMTDQAALRVYDSSYQMKTAENGAQSIIFYSQNGKVEVKPCTFVKESLAFILPPASLSRVGASEITFKLPGDEGHDSFFRPLSDAAGFELRAYADQAIFTEAPGKLVLISDIINS